jgi:hypothetical protein
MVGQTTLQVTSDSSEGITPGMGWVMVDMDGLKT